MIKSLRLRLQLFHALILALVVTLFGAAFYHQLRRSTMVEIDAELLSGARVLEGTLRSSPNIDEEETVASLSLALPRSIGRRRQPSPQQDRTNISPDTSGTQQRPRAPFSRPYFAIFADGGTLLRKEPNNISVEWVPTRRPEEYHNVPGCREVHLAGPNQMQIVVGRDIGVEMQRLTSSLIQLCLAGTGVLGLGLIGGWWLAGNAIRPIQRISHIAESINEKNLTARIETASLDRELQSLGTSLNTMLVRIENAFDKQRQFTANASHDLRTPLAVILSHCELALSRPRSVDEYKASLSTCHSAGKRIKSLVDGLLLLARTDAGVSRLRLAPVDLQELAVEAIHLFAAHAAEHHVELKLVGDSAPCLADRAAISQVVGDLLDNAIRYNRANGLVTLTTYCESGMACLEMKDTGQGIPSEALPKIFDRFYRADQTRTGEDSKKGQSGNGLGLSICKSILDAHHGTIGVTSVLHVGSSFIVKLPGVESQTEQT